MATNITDIQTPPRAPAALKWRPPQRLQGVLKPTTVIPANDTNIVVVAVSGSGRIRIVALVSAAGTLRARWRLADHTTVQATNQPADVVLAAATENIMDIPNNPGYAYLEVQIVNGVGASTVSYVDVFQTPEPN